MTFAFKSELLNAPVKTISVLFIGFVLFYSYILRIYELPYFRVIPEDEANYKVFDSFFAANWCVIVTLTTVGYGDITPGTLIGRCITMTIAISGSFMMALLVGTVTSQSELSPKH